MELTELGLDRSFEEQKNQLCDSDQRLARVTAVDCGRYVVRNEHGEVPAELTGKTYCLLGSSGVGKTTLINVLLRKGALETGTVSGTGEGRHTTRVATLLRCLMARC